MVVAVEQQERLEAEIADLAVLEQTARAEFAGYLAYLTARNLELVRELGRLPVPA
jgi:hypothetical protein